MNYIPRYLEIPVKEDLQKKMVFISGPRQCGKTTLAQKIMDDLKQDHEIAHYLNWDNNQDRETIIREQFPAGIGILVLDEIHKY
ncbi:MAG TPA: ATP-binding protein, partial [Caldithrix sp.]|nr:ATP-binding protein [Caldithrix sp.]